MRPHKTEYVFLISAFFLALALNIFVGPDLSLRVSPEIAKDVFLVLRLPRALTAVIAGGTFALCGAVFQSLFRNPIASPFTLGTASGASFGVTVFISLFSFGGFLGAAMLSVFAFSGALLSVVIVFASISGRRKFNPNSMILSGVIINFFFSGMILFIQYLTNQADAVRITRWTMGGLDVTGINSLYLTGFVFITGFTLIYSFRDDLNLLSMGEEISVSRGVNTQRAGKKLFLISSVMIGSVVSLTGPIGFIGIIAPHIASGYFGRNYRTLLPSSMITGAVILLVCDFISRAILWPVELPVGIITALIGAVFFIRIASR